jgi:hypothetical protein
MAVTTGPCLSSAFSQVSSASWDVMRSRYWDPFLDVASRQLPKDLKSFWNLCLYYGLTHPVISPLIQKISKYIVTQPIYGSQNDSVRSKYKEAMEKQIGIRSFIASFNMDYNTFGTAYCSVLFPFRKVLVCSCGKTYFADSVKYHMEGLEFYIDRCTGCGRSDVKSKAHDAQIRSSRGLRVVRWNPQYIDVEENQTNQKCTYTLRPHVLAENALRMNKRNIINNTPQQVIDAIKNKKSLQFHDDFLYVAKRPGPSNNMYKGLGVPLLMPAMKDAFVMQIMRKAQEALSFEYIMPVRIAYPTDGPNLSQFINLSDFQQTISEQLREWRRDQNRILVFPTPVTLDQIGGNGRSMLLNPELRQTAEMICAACCVAPEFLFGGASWSSSNVALRVIENDFLFNVAEDEGCMQFIASKIGDYLGWPRIEMSQKRFKMADDLQRASFDASLVGQNLLSKTTFLQSVDQEPDVELKNMLSEVPKFGEIVKSQSIYNASAQFEAQKLQMQLQQGLQEQMPQQPVEQPQQAQQAPDMNVNGPVESPIPN